MASYPSPAVEEREVDDVVADDNKPSSAEDNEGSNADESDTTEPPAVDSPEPSMITRTLMHEDCSEGLAALAAAVRAAPLLRRRVWLQDNGVDKECMWTVAHVLEECKIEELCIIEPLSSVTK